MDSLFRELNAQQQEAALHEEGPLLIIAGAGAGKTRVLTHRILHLIKRGVAPENILAITFTNKAAKEMSERVEKLIKEEPSLNFPLSTFHFPLTCTFHSLGVRVLRESGHHIGVPKHFRIYDQDDSLALVKAALKKLDLDPKQFDPKRIRGAISQQKGELVDSKAYAAEAGNQFFPRIVSQVWDIYEKTLREEKGLDFDDLLLKTVELLRTKPEIHEYYQNKFKYIHIDEYQDTNLAQYDLSKLLAHNHQNICVVGDMDQSIYSWRGADFRNILNFEKDFPRASTILLEENYRSTKTILAAANEIIKKNKVRKEKNLFTRKEDGGHIALFGAYDENEEAEFVATKARELLRGGAEPQDIAVLYRANFQSRVLEDAFLRAEIPYQVLGVKFFARREVKDVLAFISAALNPESTTDIKRIINVPPRGIGKATIAKVFAGQKGSLNAKMGQKVDAFFSTLEQIKESALHAKPSETIQLVIKKSGMHEAYKQGGEEEVERLENVYELAELAKRYDTLSPEEGIAKLLEDAALAGDQDSLVHTTSKNKKNAVRLMTVHAAKGLEFPYVFITGLEQDLFPHSGFSGNEAAEERAEEERRLFYVALTRAEKEATLTYAATRTVFGMKQINVPSEFITDIPEAYIKEEEMPEQVIE